jgi:hypothetical protein
MTTLQEYSLLNGHMARENDGARTKASLGKY